MKKKFWCHYIGNDGNTPRRRSIELTSLSDLLPRMSGKFVTPLWYEPEDEKSSSKTYVNYCLYAQLNDKVAVYVNHIIGPYEVKQMLQTDEDIRLLSETFWSVDLEGCTTDEERQRILEKREEWRQKEVDRRERAYKRLVALSDFDTYLLTIATWINKSVLRAYEEVQSPYLSVLQAMRKQFEQDREEENRRRAEEERKRREEEARKQAEEERKEQERLTQEAVKFKNGESIAGCDVVDLCRRYGIAIHLRTVHNLQQVIYEINGAGSCRYYKQKGRRPQLDGCFKTATELYDYLQTNQI